MSDETLICNLVNDFLRLEVRQMMDGSIVATPMGIARNSDAESIASLEEAETHHRQKQGIAQAFMERFAGVTCDDDTACVTIPLQGTRQHHRREVKAFIEEAIIPRHGFRDAGTAAGAEVQPIPLPYHATTNLLNLELSQLDDGAIKIEMTPTAHANGSSRAADESSKQRDDLLVALEQRLSHGHYSLQGNETQNSHTTTIPIPKHGSITPHQHAQTIAHALTGAMSDFQSETAGTPGKLKNPAFVQSVLRKYPRSTDGGAGRNN